MPTNRNLHLRRIGVEIWIVFHVGKRYYDGHNGTDPAQDQSHPPPVDNYTRDISAAMPAGFGECHGSKLTAKRAWGQLRRTQAFGNLQKTYTQSEESQTQWGSLEANQEEQDTYSIAPNS